MFTGYTDQTVDVFWGIRFNNDRAWFAEHKQEFQDAVMTPTKALAGELSAEDSGFVSLSVRPVRYQLPLWRVKR